MGLPFENESSSNGSTTRGTPAEHWGMRQRHYLDSDHDTVKALHRNLPLKSARADSPASQPIPLGWQLRVEKLVVQPAKLILRSSPVHAPRLADSRSPRGKPAADPLRRRAPPCDRGSQCSTRSHSVASAFDAGRHTRGRSSTTPMLIERHQLPYLDPGLPLTLLPTASPTGEEL